jgi:hypothetical protein
MLLLGLLLTVITDRATAQSAAAPTIDSIVVITADVFQLEEVEMNPAFGVMNTLHIKTRPQVVRRELLFKVGEPYDSARVEETKRNLRRIGLFRDVVVDTARVEGKLVVFVGTFDVWTTSLGLNARSTGGTFTWSTSLSEANLLGTSNGVSIGYSKDVDRNSVTAIGAMRRLFGSGADGTVTYRNLSDGHTASLDIQAPFRSNSDRRSFRAVGSLGSHRVLQFRDGALLETWHRENQRVYFGAQVAPSASTSGYARVGIVGQVKNDQYILARDTILSIPDSVSAAFGVSADFRRVRFKVVTHYNGFARDEDVDLSTVVRLGAVVAPKVFGYPRDGVGLSFVGQVGWPIGPNFLRAFVVSDGLFTSAGLDSGQAAGSFTLAMRMIPKQSTIFYLTAGLLDSPAPGSEWDLGHAAGGPRAFGPHAFSGTRTISGTIEHRVFAIDEVLSVIGIGFAAFLDYGGAWYADESPRKGGDVGLGLRIGPTRATGANLGRFDLAYKFGDGVTGKRWVFSFGRSLTY